MKKSMYAKGPWNVHDSKTREVLSTHETPRKAQNAAKKANASSEGYPQLGNTTLDKYGISAKDSNEYKKGGSINLKDCEIRTAEGKNSKLKNCW
jgi:hypothetical protein